MNDFRAVSLPPAMVRGLALLVRRTIARSDNLSVKGGEEIVRALFGQQPVFGQMQRYIDAEVRMACERVGISPSSALEPRALVEALQHVTPSTPVCSNCGEFPLTEIGGKVFSLSAGARCPFCSAGRLELIPMKLRVLAWTDGRLVEPEMDSDLRAVSGGWLPLTDKGILKAIDDQIHPDLWSALQTENVPVYAFLAYMNLNRKVLNSPNEAPQLLRDPHRFGIETHEQLTAAVKASVRLIAEREVTNVPSLPFIFEMEGKPKNWKRIKVAGRSYLIEGKVGSGGKADVFRGYWENRPTETVIIKIGRSPKDADLMKREANALRTLQKSKARGASHFTRIIPEIVAVGLSDDAEPITVLRYKNLYDWTLEDVLREYPEGVDPKTMVWMWNRLLMLMGWVHMNGIVHSAILPGHVLLHPLNHGATLIDWAHAVKFKRGKQLLSIADGADEAYYPAEVLEGGKPSPMTDIAISARCMISVAGGDPSTGRVPDTVPEPLAQMLYAYARYDDDQVLTHTDALQLHERFKKVSRSVFGPPCYHVFHLPRRK